MTRFKEFKSNCLEMNKREKALISSRKEVVEWLKSIDWRYFVTLTFKGDYLSKDHVYENLLKILMRMVDNEFFNKNHHKLKKDCKRRCFEGIVVRELQSRGVPHYHILIQDNPVFKRRNKSFEDVLKKKAKVLKGGFQKLLDHEKGIHVQDYYKGNLEEYLTKEFRRTPSYEFISPLSYRSDS